MPVAGNRHAGYTELALRRLGVHSECKLRTVEHRGNVLRSWDRAQAHTNHAVLDVECILEASRGDFLCDKSMSNV